MMKISKLLKVGAFALLAGSLCFVGCKNDDDENSVIQGSGNTKTIDYANTDNTEGTCRGYSTTALKHQGELVRLTLTGTSGTTTETYSKYANKTYGGVMGYIWDLSIADAENKTSKRNFFVLGLAVNPTSYSGKVKYYVSRYFNVTNIYDKNFGAEDANKVTSPSAANVTNGTTCEMVISDFTELSGITTNDSKLVIWADIYPTLISGKTHTAGTQDKEADYTGGWTIDFYKGTADSNTPGDKITTVDIPAEKTGYIAGSETEDSTNKKLHIPQNYMACYANVYNNYRVTGEWYQKSDYFVDSVVEE
ncbi:hypothetical protein [Treponema sp.]|uniref:hypothetical protein n=1 Tax=Treponema sp. TaxID=166 RepID=UPI0025D5F259|nr:hypothetical protein [Treponema sp.]MBR4322983.1 hypothetical protein [Treponema sp.]